MLRASMLRQSFRRGWQASPALSRAPPYRVRKICTAGPPLPPPPTLLHCAAGAAAFVALDRATAALLEARAIAFPSSVAAIAVLGAAASVPPVGAALQAALGPGSAWLRSILPWLLVPQIP